jgi:hypothetical protein
MSQRFIRDVQNSNVIRNCGLLIAVFLFIAIYAIGPEFLVPTQINDALTVSAMSMNVNRDMDGGGGYYYTALLLSMLSKREAAILQYAIAILFFYVVFRKIHGFQSVSVALFLTISPIFLFLTLFVKDTFTPLLTIVVLIILATRGNAFVKLLLVACIYLPYGLYFRSYYIGIVGVFAALVAIEKIEKKWVFLMGLIALGICLFIPKEYIQSVGDIRDFLNRGRAWDNMAGSRTVFYNLLPSDNIFNFIINYFYAIFRLNFAFLLSPRPQELFLALNLGVYFSLTLIGVRAADARVRLPTLLFVAHFGVMMLFEPDLGSYLRHTSSVLLYLVPALTLWDARQRRANPPADRRARRLALGRPGRA